MSRVDLIIPTRNHPELLEACLRSLTHSRFTDYRLIVFDDCSDQPVASLVRTFSPGATIVRSTRNVGLAHGLNAAIRAGSSELVALLNDDTEVEPDWLDELVACADRHPDTGSIASKLRLQSDRQRLHSAGDTYSVRAMPGNRGVWLEDFGQYDAEDEVFGACAGAALYRRSALSDVALENGDVFDSRLFMYCEDVDLSWRLQIAGYPCRFAPSSVVYHRLSASGGGRLASYYVSRNIWLVYARSVPREIFRPFRRRMVAYHAGRIARMFRHAREPAARAALRGTAAGLIALAWHRPIDRRLEWHETARIRRLMVDRDALRATDGATPRLHRTDERLLHFVV